MIIKRILTNNALIVEGELGREHVVCGKGIGFKRKVGEEIDENLINQIFVLSNNGLTKDIETLLNEIPIKYIEISNELLKYARIELGKKLNDSIILSLSDHLKYVIDRFSQGIELSNSFFYELEHFYPDEYMIGKYGLEVIERNLGIKLPTVEASNIALHIVNAEMDDINLSEVYNIMSVVENIMTIVKDYFSVDFDTKSASYYRFMTHLKYFAKRMLANNQYCEESSEILDIVKKRYSTAFACSEKVKLAIKNEYNYDISNEELQYLTIHIQRVVNINDSSKEEVEN